MKYNVEFTFTGAMKCKVLFCTVGQYGCGCDTCKSWLTHETCTFSDMEDCTFGFLSFEKSPETQAYSICSHHIMYMNLVPFDDNTGRKAEDLDLTIYGGDLGGTWSDTVVVDGHTCSLKVRVYDPANPNKVTKVANKLQLDFAGAMKCKLAHTSLSSCGCDDCKWWKQWETTCFSDKSDLNYGLIFFETSPETKTFDLCPHYVIAMNLTPFDDDTVRKAADLDLLVSGSDIGGLWEDQVEIGGQSNTITAKVYNASSTYLPTQSYPSMAKKTRTLQFEFTGTKKCKMVFTISSSCGCSTCRWWSQYETATFADEPDRNYGVIFFETSPYTTTFDVCSRLEMHMNLVAFAAESNKAEDLDVIVTSDTLNKTFSDTVDVDGEPNKVVVKVLKSRKATKTIPAGNQATNKLQLEFSGGKKCRLLVSPDPELDCECESCSFWLKFTTTSFADQPEIKYAFVNFETSPSTQSFNICSSSVMLMNLVPFNETTPRNAADLDMQIYGSDVGCTWTDKVVVDGAENVVKITISAPPNRAPAAKPAAAPAAQKHSNNNNQHQQYNNHYNNNNAAYIRAMQLQNLRIRQAQAQRAQIQTMQAAYGFGQVLGTGLGNMIGNMVTE